MADEMLAALRRGFGFAAFRAGQAAAIGHVLAGRDLLAVMPTGAGKSLIYQLPALLDRVGTTLVISPLIALMKDQVDALTARGHPVTLINSSLAPEEANRRTARLTRGDYRLVYIAPERLRSGGFVQALRRARIARVAVDEAHCISQWGHDFRPDYLHVRRVIETLGRPPVVALTATATRTVQGDIAEQLGLRDPAHLVTGFNRPNLSFEVVPTRTELQKASELTRLLREAPGSAVVYSGRRRDAEAVAEALTAEGVAADFYHAGLDAPSRRQAQDAFMAGETRVIVATNAFGMGIDKPDIRLVVHYHLPGTLEAYYQEAGRAGRDGAPARCVLFYHERDLGLQEWFIDNDAPSPAELRRLEAAIRASALPEPAGIAHFAPAELLAATGLTDVKLRLGLHLLEQAGGIARQPDAAGRAHLRLLRPLLDVDFAVPLAQIERRRAQKRRQLDQIVDYATAATCRRRAILDYFGDPDPAPAERCCDVCLRPRPASRGAVAAPSQGATALGGAGGGRRPAGLDLWGSGEAAALARAVLRAAATFPAGFGRRDLSYLLIGRQPPDGADHSRNPHFGTLAHVSRSEIQNVVTRLVAGRYLALVPADPDRFSVTEDGRAALAALRSTE